MNNNLGMLSIAGAILIAAVIFAFSHRYQVTATSSNNESDFMAFDNWTGHWLSSKN